MRRSLACLTLAALVPAGLNAQSTYEQLQTFSGVLGHVRLNYVDSVSTSHLVRAAIAGMLSSLDPHSHFETREEIERLLAWRAGRLAATGIITEQVEGAVAVLTVFPGSPAARSGVAPGDRVVELNDTSVAGLSAAAVQSRLVGERGTRVRLLLERGPREEPESVRVRLSNDYLRPQAVGVARTLAPGIGYVRLEEFLASAGHDLHEAVERSVRGPEPKALILDLRGNPGGNLDAAVDVASEFLPRDAVVFRTRGRRRELDREFRTSRDGSFRALRLVVLIDDRTASAAEVVAGSLQDHDRAELFGRRSFGKALIQQLLEVPPAGDAVWLTVGYVLTPSGRLIQRRYRDMNTAQYYSRAGTGGSAEDTLPTFRTDGGRIVRGGGGIVPDSALPRPAALPAWFSASADSGLALSVADSVAVTVPADAGSRIAWLDARAEWRGRLLEPFLQRVRARVGVRAEPDSAVAGRVAIILAARVAEVRWGLDAADDFRLHNDADVAAALEAAGRLVGRPAGPRR